MTTFRQRKSSWICVLRSFTKVNTRFNEYNWNVHSKINKYFSRSTWLRTISRIFVHIPTLSANLAGDSFLECRVFRCGAVWAQSSSNSANIENGVRFKRRRLEFRGKISPKALGSRCSNQFGYDQRRSRISTQYLFWTTGVRCNPCSIDSWIDMISYSSTFTCNMHAFGLNKDLCDEFLRKQSVISNITKGI